MIEIKNLNFKKKNNQILKNINLLIKTGEKVAIVGANGAGKTTLVESILNINKKWNGEIIFDFKYDKSPLEKIGVQFQDSNYPEGLSVREIIDFFKSKSLKIDHSFVDKMINEFKVNEFIDIDSSKISGGQAQKLNVLLALLSKPDILFMDELTTGLDVSSRSVITNFVSKYIASKEKTLILVTHTPGEIERFIDRVIVLKNGEISQDVKTKDIIKKYLSIELFLNQL